MYLSDDADKNTNANSSNGGKYTGDGNLNVVGTEASFETLMSSGFKIPQKNILVSIGDDKYKYEFINSINILKNLGYSIYATEGTYLYFNKLQINKLLVDK